MARPSVLLSASKRQDGSSGSPPVRSAKVTPPGTPTAQAQEIRPAIEAIQALLSSGDLDLDAFLDQIAQGALKLTGAAGAAVAIRQDQLILCRARCGESSPPLGAKLDLNSGISGECLRTGRALQCSDTETDSRVDRDVCRRLGVRSIAVVPIRKETRTVGILEVVFAKVQAFEDAQLQVLADLADLVAAALIGTVDGEITLPQPVAASPAPRSVLQPKAGGVLRVEPTSATQGGRGRSKRRSGNLNERFYWAIAIAVFLMADMVIAISLLRKEAHLKAASATPGQTLGLPGTSVPGKPSAEMQKVRGKTESVSTNLVIAPPSPAGRTVPTDHRFDLSEEKPSHSPEQRQTSQHETPIIVRGEVPRNHQLPGDVSPDSPPAPLSQLGTAGLAEGAEAIGKVLPPSSLPKPLVPVFQGISGGTLDRNVNPIYPPEALGLRLEGSVVLSVVIDETGNVRILKTLSGDPILARAAIDAVRQWHYHPYLLNGQPVKRQAKVTLTFKLP